MTSPAPATGPPLPSKRKPFDSCGCWAARRGQMNEAAGQRVFSGGALAERGARHHRRDPHRPQLRLQWRRMSPWGRRRPPTGQPLAPRVWGPRQDRAPREDRRAASAVSPQTLQRTMRAVPSGETSLQQAERHVREAEKRVEQQRRLVEELARDGHSTRVAVMTLTEYRAALRHFRDSLARLRRTSGSP